MATLYNSSPGSSHFATFNPVSTALANLPNGAGTIAALIAKDSGAGSVDCCGLIDGTPTVGNWYHFLNFQSDRFSDDDGIVSTFEGTTWASTTDWYIGLTSWPAGGAALTRFHRYDWSTPAGWTHVNSSANNGGNRAGPSAANGRWRIGYGEDNSGTLGIALVAAWAGVQLSDAQAAELSVNGKTSDWWNCSGGNPTLLIECTSLTPTDIGANPSTFSSIGGLTLADPAIGALTGWTFDGTGVPPEPVPTFKGGPRRGLASVS